MKGTEYAIIILLIFAGMLIYPFVGPYLPQPKQKNTEPTIIALDVNSFAVEAVKQGFQDPTSEAISRVNETARELASRGYFVLHSDSILAVPDGYLLTTYPGAVD